VPDNDHPALCSERIELTGAGADWTEAFLLNERLTFRIANLGMWDAKGGSGWVNDTPEGNERDVADHALWLDGIAALASSLTRSERNQP
jgi:hypothetical protein